MQKEGFMHSSTLPINKSPSKQLYSFAKAVRFNRNKKRNYSLYNLPSTLSNIYASFGKGSRTNPVSKNGLLHPSPNKYNINLKKKFTSGSVCSFGYGRNQMKNVINRKTPDQTIPGPGTYNDLYNIIGKQSLKYTLKENPYLGKFSQTISPSPDKYIIRPSISRDGSQILSTYKSSLARRWNPPRLKGKPRKNSIGPGKYFDKTFDISSIGIYFISNYPSSKCQKFSKSQKNKHSISELIRGKTPGPCAYRTYSEFGYDLSTIPLSKSAINCKARIHKKKSNDKRVYALKN